MRVLLVEDNDELAEMVADRFLAEGHAIDREANGAHADSLMEPCRFDLLILDINPPGLSGTDMLRRLRARGDRTPVLILTARSEIDDRAPGRTSAPTITSSSRSTSANWPRAPARWRRRRSGEAENRFVAGGLVYDRAAKRATLDGADLELRPRDAQVLEVFLGALGRALSKEEVADRLYAFEETPTPNAVEQAVVRLRRKLEGSPLRLRTIRGLGYIADVRE